MCINTIIVYACGLVQSMKSEPCKRSADGKFCVKHEMYQQLEERCPWTCANPPHPAPQIESREILVTAGGVEGVDEARDTDGARRGSIEEIEERTVSLLDQYLAEQGNKGESRAEG